MQTSGDAVLPPPVGPALELVGYEAVVGKVTENKLKVLLSFCF